MQTFRATLSQDHSTRPLLDMIFVVADRSVSRDLCLVSSFMFWPTAAFGGEGRDELWLEVVEVGQLKIKGTRAAHTRAREKAPPIMLVLER